LNIGKSSRLEKDLSLIDENDYHPQVIDVVCIVINVTHHNPKPSRKKGLF
jgi:hypothetical protein